MVDGQAADRRSGSERRLANDRRRLPDRRSGSDRRHLWAGNGNMSSAGWRFGSAQALQDRRSGDDRRAGADNRLGIDRRSGMDRRVGVEWRQHDLGERLSAEQALALVADFYSASMDARFWPSALSKLSDALGADAVALASYDVATGTGMIEHAVGVDVDQVGSYADVYARSNVWLQREEMLRTPGAVLLDTDVVEDREGEASEYYQRWLAPQNLEHQIFGILERQTSDVLYLFLARSAVAGPFGADDVALLRRLVPYLQRGLRAGQMLRRGQEVRQAAMDALEIMPVGVMLVTIGGAVLGANQVAREALNASRDVLSVGRGGLGFMRDGRRVHFRELMADKIKNAHSNSAPQSVAFPIARSSGLRPLSVLVCPVRTLQGNDRWEQPAAVVFIGDADQKNNVDEGRLRQLYGLTAAEARVASLLARGYRLDQISEMLDVAYETTRKHLKKVLSKADTDRQAELVRMVVTGPGGLVG